MSVIFDALVSLASVDEERVLKDNSSMAFSTLWYFSFGLF